jgi:hypothetical protein
VAAARLGGRRQRSEGNPRGRSDTARTGRRVVHLRPAGRHRHPHRAVRRRRALRHRRRLLPARPPLPVVRNHQGPHAVVGRPGTLPRLHTPPRALNAEMAHPAPRRRRVTGRCIVRHQTVRASL